MSRSSRKKRNIKTVGPTLPVGTTVLDKLAMIDFGSQANYKDVCKEFQGIVDATGGETLQIPVQHDLHGGLYGRTLFVKAGIAIVGAIHKEESLMIVHGHCLLRTEEGLQRIAGYAVLPTKAGQWRLGYAIEDTIFTTVHRTEFKTLMDLHNIQDEQVMNSENLKNTQVLELS